MIEGLKPYAEYKESGHRWLGSVPTHWSVLPNRALFDEVKDRNHPTEEMLSVTITRGIVRQKGLLEGSSKKDSSNLNKGAYKLVQPNDIAYNKMRAWQGALGASALRGIISPAYVVMRARKDTNPWFYHNLYRTPSFAKEAERLSYGITSDMWSLRPEHFKVIGSVLPPPDEQAAIVRFLHHANRKIDGFIHAKRKLIGLLNEQKQAIVFRAVTRGICANVSLKPSGIPWLGDIPAHWVISPARGLFKEVIDRGHAGEQMLSVTIKRGVITQAQLLESSIKRDSSRQDRGAYKLVCVGDIAYNKMRAWQGSFGASGLKGIVSPAYVVIRPRNGVGYRFYHYLFRTPAFAKEAERWSYGIASDMWSLRPEHFRLIMLPLPGITEQDEISDHLDGELVSYNTAIARTGREIALMQEYRTRLTADLVTGKLDVREAAAELPATPVDTAAEPAPEEPLEESETEEIEV